MIFCSRQSVVLRFIGLHDNFSLLISPACPAGDLRHQLEGSLRRAIVRNVQRRIRRNHADQAHILKIQSLRHQLRSDQDLRFTPGKSAQNPVQISPGLYRIQIQPIHWCFREKRRCRFFHLLRSDAKVTDIGAAAFRTAFRYRELSSAVMAYCTF